MPTTMRDLDEPTVQRYITRIRQLGGVEEDERNPSLLCRYRLNNSIVKIYRSKAGFTIHCNSASTLQRVTETIVPATEITDNVEFDDSGWGCEKVDAEILTNNGWKYYDQLNPSDMIMTYLDNGEIEWSKFTKVMVYDFDGELIHLHNNTLDVRVTDNHHFKVLRRVGKRDTVTKKWKVVGYKSHYISLRDMKSNDRIPRTGVWRGKKMNYFALPEIEGVSNPRDLKIWIEDWVAFLGVFLAEGSTDTNQRQIHISQKKPENKKAIKHLLKRLPFQFTETNNGFRCRNERLWEYLKQFGKCYDKFIPKEVLDLPPKYLKILFDWLVLGDGNVYWGHNGTSKHIDYYTTSKKLKDGVEELLLKLNYSYNTIARRRSGKFALVGRLKKDAEKYTGKVFDLEVPNGRCFYVRRSGKGYFTGNSLFLGVVVGGHHIESGKILFRDVGVEYFQPPRFERKTYLQQVTRRCRKILCEIDVPKATTQLHFCTGFVLSDAVRYFTEMGYNVTTTKIIGRLQNHIKNHYKKMVDDTGLSKALTRSDLPAASAPLSEVERMLQYAATHPDIWRLCKTGWRSFRSYVGNVSTLD